MLGGVRGRELITPSYSIIKGLNSESIIEIMEALSRVGVSYELRSHIEESALVTRQKDKKKSDNEIEKKEYNYLLSDKKAFTNNVKANLEYVLKTKGLTQQELADKLGCTVSAIGMLKNAKNVSTTLKRVINFAECSIDEFCGKDLRLPEKLQGFNYKLQRRDYLIRLICDSQDEKVEWQYGEDDKSLIERYELYNNKLYKIKTFFVEMDGYQIFYLYGIGEKYILDNNNEAVCRMLYTKNIFGETQILCVSGEEIDIMKKLLQIISEKTNADLDMLDTDEKKRDYQKLLAKKELYEQKKREQEEKDKLQYAYYDKLKKRNQENFLFKSKVLRICLIEYYDKLEKWKKEDLFLNIPNLLDAEESCMCILKKMNFYTIEELLEYECSEDRVVAYLEKVIEDTRTGKLVWKSREKFIFQTEDIKIFNKKQSILQFDIIERKIIFCGATIVSAMDSVVISKNMEELYNVLDWKVKVVGRKDLQFFRWDTGNFEYPEWYSSSRYVCKDELDEFVYEIEE